MYIPMHFGNRCVVFKQLQGGPLPLISGVISPLSRVIIVITPTYQLFSAIKKGAQKSPAKHTNDRLGGLKATAKLPCFFCRKHLGVSKNMGTPKWMVKIMENLIKMDDLGGYHYFWKHPSK